MGRQRLQRSINQLHEQQRVTSLNSTCFCLAVGVHFTVLGELYANKDLQSASTAGLGVWIGMAIGIAARVAVAFVMVGVFLLARFV
jgi:uncharacterized protein YqgC (DUF456 family)